MQDVRLPVVLAMRRYERLDDAQVQRLPCRHEALNFRLRESCSEPFDLATAISIEDSPHIGSYSYICVAM